MFSSSLYDIKLEIANIVIKLFWNFSNKFSLYLLYVIIDKYILIQVQSLLKSENTQINNLTRYFIKIVRYKLFNKKKKKMDLVGGSKHFAHSTTMLKKIIAKI